MHGRGHILRIDLSRESVDTEALSPELCAKYLGGQGINSYLLWEHFLRVDPQTDPLGPDNVLIAGLGPLGGTGYGAGSKMKWTFKSPAYNLFGDSTCGGWFGATLRWAGYDHVVITGRAAAPVYIWIDDDRVEIRKADHLWGKDTEEVDCRLKEELGDERVQVATAGPAAENGVTFASLVVSGGRVAGRTGAGAVLTSKNLKAIAVRGTQGISVYDDVGFVEAANRLITAMDSFPQYVDSRRAYGTLTSVVGYQIRGGNAYRNCQASVLPDDRCERLNHERYQRELAAGALTCSPGCIMGCSGWYAIKGWESPAARKYAGATGIKPEYLAVANLGITLDLPDLPAVAYLADLCSRYSMDVMEVGACCGLLMELWERRILSEADTVAWLGEPLSLAWGNLEAIEKVVHAIAFQNNPLGRLLQKGVYQAALRLEEIKGVPILPYAMYGKGGSPFTEDVRSRPSWATNMAVAARGACHLRGYGTLDQLYRPDISQLYFGTPDAANPLDLTLKGASSAMAEKRTAVINALGLCVFTVGVDPIRYPLEMFAQALLALTGQHISAAAMLQAGERIVNLEKAFNARLGYRREDDTLCHRWLHEAKPNEPGRGWKAADFLEQTKDEYYAFHGWDRATSLQRRQKLEELGLQEVAEVLEKEGALAP
jgi:aldehyde:ferredoxin oxidoreductase